MDNVLAIVIVFAPMIVLVYYIIAKKKYSKYCTKEELTGYDIARKILDRYGMEDTYIVESREINSNRYNNISNSIMLSRKVYNGVGVDCLAISAQVCGNVVQYKKVNGGLLKFAYTIDALVSFSMLVLYIMIIISCVIHEVSLFNYLSAILLIILFYKFLVFYFQFKAKDIAFDIVKNMNLDETEEYYLEKMMKVVVISSFVSGFTRLIDELS